MLIKTFDKHIGVDRTMIKLNKQALKDLTNKACGLLYNVKDADEHNVLAFPEHNDGTVTVELLTGNQGNGKSDLFPRGSDPSLHIYSHLAALYGMDDAF